MYRMWVFFEVFYKVYIYILLFKMIIYGYVSYLFLIWINCVMVWMIFCDILVDIWLLIYLNNCVDFFVCYGSCEFLILKWIVENLFMICFMVWVSLML